jgi:hypothetical protein
MTARAWLRGRSVMAGAITAAALASRQGTHQPGPTAIRRGQAASNVGVESHAAGPGCLPLDLHGLLHRLSQRAEEAT